MPIYPGLPGNVVRTVGTFTGDNNAIAVWSGANTLEAHDLNSGGNFPFNVATGRNFAFASEPLTSSRILKLRDVGGTVAFLDDIVKLHEGL